MIEQKIIIPDGFKLEKVSETEYKIISDTIVSAEKVLPKSWAEFCKNYPLRKGESWVDNSAVIQFITGIAGTERNDTVNIHFKIKS